MTPGPRLPPECTPGVWSRPQKLPDLHVFSWPKKVIFWQFCSPACRFFVHFSGKCQKCPKSVKFPSRVQGKMADFETKMAEKWQKRLVCVCRRGRKGPTVQGKVERFRIKLTEFWPLFWRIWLNLRIYRFLRVRPPGPKDLDRKVMKITPFGVIFCPSILSYLVKQRGFRHFASNR